MAYFKINDVDFSSYVTKLHIGYEHRYKGMTNAAGNTLVKYTSTKRIIEVGIIPLDAEAMKTLQSYLNLFQVNISYLDAQTGELQENVKCIIPQQSVEYYTIQADNVKFKAFSFTCNEL